MSRTADHSVTLVPHPASAGGAAGELRARVRREPAGVLAVRYSIRGDLARLRVPTPRPPRVAQELWRHACCECFVAIAGRPGYHEFNFSFSGEWALFAFSGYRVGAPLEDPSLEPKITVRRTDQMIELDASISLRRLSREHLTARLALGLSAIVEDEDAALSYWALRHPPGNPDFHDRDSFILELE